MAQTTKTCTYCNGECPADQEVCFCGRRMPSEPSQSKLKDPSLVLGQQPAVIGSFTPGRETSSISRSLIGAIIVAAAIVAAYCVYAYLSPFANGTNRKDFTVSGTYQDVTLDGTFIVGTVTNDSDRSFKDVQIDIDLINGSRSIGTASARVGSLAQHEQWQFRAPTNGYSYTSFILRSVKGN